MINTNKAHAKVIVFKFKKFGSQTNCENIVVLFKHGVEILPDEASLSWDWLNI